MFGTSRDDPSEGERFGTGSGRDADAIASRSKRARRVAATRSRSRSAVGGGASVRGDIPGYLRLSRARASGTRDDETTP